MEPQECDKNSSQQSGIDISSIKPFIWIVIGLFYAAGLVMFADGDEDVVTTLNKIGAGCIFTAAVLQMAVVFKSKKIWPQVLAGILVGIAIIILVSGIVIGNDRMNLQAVRSCAEDLMFDECCREMAGILNRRYGVLGDIAYSQSSKEDREKVLKVKCEKIVKIKEIEADRYQATAFFRIEVPEANMTVRMVGPICYEYLDDSVQVELDISKFTEVRE